MEQSAWLAVRRVRVIFRSSGKFQLRLLLLALSAAALSSPIIFAAEPTISSLLEQARILRQSGKPAEAKPLAEKAMALAEGQKSWLQLVNARRELSFEESLSGNASVMVSLWAISDESTAYLMDHFYGRLQQGQDKAKSLRGAMLDTMGKYPAPLNWAAFILMGETAVSPASATSMAIRSRVRQTCPGDGIRLASSAWYLGPARGSQSGVQGNRVLYFLHDCDVTPRTCQLLQARVREAWSKGGHRSGTGRSHRVFACFPRAVE